MTDYLTKKTLQTIDIYMKLNNKKHDDRPILLTTNEKMDRICKKWNMDEDSINKFSFVNHNASNTMVDACSSISNDLINHQKKMDKNKAKIDQEIEKYRQKILVLQMERDKIDEEPPIDFQDTMNALYNEEAIFQDIGLTDVGEGIVRRKIQDYLFDGELVANKIARKKGDVIPLSTNIVELIETNGELNDIWVAKYHLTENNFTMVYPSNGKIYPNLSKFIQDHYNKEKLTTTQQPFKSGSIRVIRKSLREKKKSNDYSQGTNYLTDLAFLKTKDEYDKGDINGILLNK